MQLHNNTCAASDSRSNQRGRILRLLIEARGDWVSLPEISACAAQYNARIFELRRLGFSIVNRTAERDGVRHSWFRLASTSVQASSPATPASADRVVSLNSQTKSAVDASDPRVHHGDMLPLFREGNQR
jgi:hypothetical protein